MKEEKRLEDATASLGERSITGYAETTCRRARMYAVPIGLSGRQYLVPNPYDNKVASSRRMNYTATNPRTFSALLRMYGVIDRSPRLAVAFSKRFNLFYVFGQTL